MNVNMQQATQAAKKMADAGGDSHFLEEQMNPTRIKQYLDSAKDYDKVKGMKWLLAMMSKGRDASEFFSDVVKNVVAKSVEVKKMVRYLAIIAISIISAGSWRCCRSIVSRRI